MIIQVSYSYLRNSLVMKTMVALNAKNKLKIVTGEYNEPEANSRNRAFLDECYANVRGQILLMQPMPTVAKAYSMIRQEEKQREGYNIQTPVSAALSAHSNYSRNNQFHNNRGTRNYNQGSNGNDMAVSARMDELQNQLNQIMLMMEQNSKEQTGVGSFNSSTKSYTQAVKGSRWIDDMSKELQVFKINCNSDGSIERFNARLVAKGCTQKEGNDYTKTFAPVAKMVTVKTFIATAVHHHWHIAQLDINNAFLHGDLHEEVYMTLPQGYKPSTTISQPALSSLETSKESQCLKGSKLLYLIITEPDLSYAAHCLSQFIHAPRTPHFDAMIKVLRYIKLCPGQGLHFPNNSSLQLKAYCDSDWANCPITRRSITGFCIFLGSCIISWQSKKQSVVSRCSTKEEYRALADCTCEITWL
ncbi:putative copia-type protein [Tanacetum coccineum]